MQYYPFDSRNPIYKSKQMAVAAGESLRLRLLLHKDALCCNAYLRLNNDFLHTSEEIELEPGEWLEDYRFFSCDLTLDTGLYWYSFRYTSAHGEFFVKRHEHSLGIVEQNPNIGTDWQLTVYKKNDIYPDWLNGGIIYQIFPDRFNKSGIAKQNIPSDRFMVTDWQKQPEYRQNNGPCSLNNDYYGGDLKGIEQKLDYLNGLGVNCIYLNPIFEAHSNHRYNTADYNKIDPCLGNEEDFISLCKKAHKKGIHIILDGVFSHTGDDSLYFDKYLRYNSGGAFTNQNSPYFGWYKFTNWPNAYNAWWGVPSLPEIEENNPDFTEFITGENSIIAKWLRLGADGWRLDVADELPDEFLEKLRARLKAEKPNGYLLGEVWEDATNKISYSKRRKFLLGNQLDSVMNYPFASAIINFAVGGKSRDFIDTVLDIIENYPRESLHLLMNHIGTHDTARILTVLSLNGNLPRTRAEQSHIALSDGAYKNGVKLLKLCAALQFTLPGIPSIYYGDEAGVLGGADPFCRATYPWGNENTELLEFYRALGNFRVNHPCFKNGDFVPLCSDEGTICFARKSANDKVLIAVNRTDNEVYINIPTEFCSLKAFFGNSPDNSHIKVDPKGVTLLS